VDASITISFGCIATIAFFAGVRSISHAYIFGTVMALMVYLHTVVFVLGVVKVKWVRYLGATDRDVQEMLGPFVQNLDDFFQRVDQDSCTMVDGWCRKLSHILWHLSYMVLHHVGVDRGHYYMYGLVYQQLFCLFTIVVTKAVFIHIDFWFTDLLFYGSYCRIRDNSLKRINILAVEITEFWGYLLGLVIWRLFLVPLYAPEQHALLLWFIWAPAAVGDCMAEIVGSTYGGRIWQRFGVVGIGDLNTKSWEGVLGMILSTYSVSAGAMILLGAPPGWWLGAFFMSTTTAIVEAFTPRGFDSLTISVSAVTSIILVCQQ
jgi:dolichol kinase